MAAVSVGGMREVSICQPVWATFMEEREELRMEIEEQLVGASREKLIVGGDFNANWGKSQARVRVCGKYGIGSEAGRELLDWCEENGLVIVNSFLPHKNRGMSFHNRFRRWYELDGFLMRKEQQRGMVRRMKVDGAGGLSNNEVNCLEVERQVRRWRRAGRIERVPKMRWQRLLLPEVKEDFREKMMEVRKEEEAREGEEDEWSRLTRVMMKAAEEACGVEERTIQNPGTVGHEKEIRD